MAGSPVNTGFNYLAAAQSAKTQPAPSQGGPGGDVLELHGMFSVEQEATETLIKKEQAPEKPGIETAYVTFSKVFCLWRAWDNCARCQNAIASGHAVLPNAGGDYTCPHNQAADYKELLDKAMKGECAIAVKEPFQTMEPTARYCHVEWMEVDPLEVERMKKREEEKKKNRVYPPDIEAAFKKET